MPTSGRLRAVTILIVVSALLSAGSMALPIDYEFDRYQPGWTLAWLAAFGAAHAYPLCVLGLLANLLIVSGWIVVLVRRAGFAHRAGGLGGVIVSAIGLGAMVVSWVWMAGTVGNPAYIFGSSGGRQAPIAAMTPASIAWLLSGLLLVIAAAMSRLRVGVTPVVPGFEVLQGYRPPGMPAVPPPLPRREL